MGGLTPPAADLSQSLIPHIKAAQSQHLYAPSTPCNIGEFSIKETHFTKAAVHWKVKKPAERLLNK